MIRKCTLFPLISVTLFGVPVAASAGWMRTYGADGYDAGYCVRETADGGYIIAGYEGGEGGWLLKTDAAGDTLWTLNPYDLADGEAYSVQETSDGGYVATGYCGAAEDGKNHLALLKCDSTGEVVWSRTDIDWFPHDTTGGVGLSVCESADGGYVVTGRRQPMKEEPITDLWLIKTDSTGGLEWSKTYGGPTPDWGTCVRETADGGFIIAATQDFYTTANIWLLRTDAEGNRLWEWTQGGDRNSLGLSVCLAADGGYVVAGKLVWDAAMYQYLWLGKVNSSGNEIWQHRYARATIDSDSGFAFWVEATSDGGYILAGSPYALFKTNPEGYRMWYRDYGVRGRSVQQTADGGYIVTGTKEGDIYLLKTDSLGDTLGIVEEPPASLPPDWYITNPVGEHVILRYRNHPCGFAAQVFDAAGRKVDELHSAASSGAIRWGQGCRPGVYFIRSSQDTGTGVVRVIIIR